MLGCKGIVARQEKTQIFDETVLLCKLREKEAFAVIPIAEPSGVQFNVSGVLLWRFSSSRETGVESHPITKHKHRSFLVYLPGLVSCH